MVEHEHIAAELEFHKSATESMDLEPAESAELAEPADSAEAAESVESTEPASASPAECNDSFIDPASRRLTMPQRRSNIEARIDLFQSHAFWKVELLLKSFDEGFKQVYFDRIDSAGVLSDEYDNGIFNVAYCLHDHGRDEVWISWSDELDRRGHRDEELVALARQIAHLLGGGTNLRLLEPVLTTE